MAEKKEISGSESHERLKIWIGLVKVVVISFFASVTLVEMAKVGSKAKVKVAEIQNGVSAPAAKAKP